MNYNQILSEFERQFGHLTKYGLQIHGIVNLIADDKVISISTPFIFDNRQVPKKFMGLNVRGGTPENEMPLDFQNIDNNKEYLWAYQRFEEFVDNNVGLIRKTLDKPDMTREDILGAICFGDFKKHRDMCLQWENDGAIPKWKK